MEHRIIQQSDGEILKHWLQYSVPYGEYGTVKMRLAEACGIPSHTLNNWLYHKVRVPEPAKKMINKVTLEVSGKEIYFHAEKTIRFGKCTATLNAEPGRAFVCIMGSTLPLKLADKIDEAEGLSVSGVYKDDVEMSTIEISHRRELVFLLQLVVAAIEEVFGEAVEIIE
ncbi:MAG: helix-turn-helix domain-containing protein [Clostridium sp.]|nr:helix-turn-helix domain-containing protein [Clostridium sp.]